MCGIVGVFGQLTLVHENMFSDLLIFDQVRGFDSTGVCIVDRPTLTPKTLKGVCSPAWLLGSVDYAQATVGANHCLIGHNRAATKGTVTDENAHPFTHGHITGVHNGTATSTYNLLDHDKFIVDSDNIFYHICHKGPQDLWQNFYGAATLVWWDDNEKALFMLRNSQRPMHLALTNDEQCLIWSSEKEILAAATERRKISHGEIVEMTPNNLYKYTYDKKVVLETVACPAYTPVTVYRNDDFDDWGYNRQAYKKYQKRTEEKWKEGEENGGNKKTPETYKGRENYSSRSNSTSVNKGTNEAYKIARRTLDDIDDINESMFPFVWLRARSRFSSSTTMANFMSIHDGKTNGPIAEHTTKYH